MSVDQIIAEVLYRVQHITGVVPNRKHYTVVRKSLELGYHPADIEETLIIITHEDYRNYRPNPNLRSCDW